MRACPQTQTIDLGSGSGPESAMASKKQQQFQFGPWRFTISKSHILKSACEKGLQDGCSADGDACSVCRFSHELSLPSLPEMVFPESQLCVEEESGCSIKFSALAALKRVDATTEPLKVAAAEEWRKTRTAEMQKVKEQVRPFDWTYTTDYRGSLEGVKAEETQECIDYERLKQQEQILFYDDVILFEDELADNGTAVLSVKIRVMASGFFILQRFFLRVDGVLVRINDTRIYHQFGTGHLLREYMSKEAKLSELKIHPALLTDANKLNSLLPVKQTCNEKLLIPEQKKDCEHVAKESQN